MRLRGGGSAVGVAYGSAGTSGGISAARKFKRAFAAVVSASGEGTLRVVRLGSMTRS
jgi:hypothetical protein